MVPNKDKENNYEYLLKNNVNDKYQSNLLTVKNVSFKEPKFEYSGACAGCGETPYITNLTRVFNDNLIIANEILKKSRYDKAVKEKIKQITKTDLTIHFNDVSSYLFKNDGNVVNIRDNDLKTVGAEQIDQASNYLSDIFEDLCNIDTYE